MEKLELVSFQIISSVGLAKSSYIEAIQEAKKGNFEKAKACINEGKNSFAQAHKAHFELIQSEARGDVINPTLLLLHAEDQMMSAETCKILAEELIENYERIIALEKR
ncbi:PTS lactose/cellobiose transporter subunit IIA [Sporosarcina sp. NPDC096371]|uniref:PTS lactose/cellobiose transporter subunit IIA n=1 Tax=Sporosarcina sp. NPDC096371 TaxID=3364530 RepID=UPI003818EA79